MLVFYYKKWPDANLKGSLLALLLSFIIVAAVLYGVVPGIITVGGWFELFFTNTLGMPFNTGTIIYIFVLVAGVVWAIYETYTNKSLTRENIAFLVAVATSWYTFLWIWLERIHHRSSNPCHPMVRPQEMQEHYYLPCQEYSLTVYAHADDRLLILCPHHHPFYIQSPNGSELA